MNNTDKTKEQLLDELEELRQRIAGLEKAEKEFGEVEETLRIRDIAIESSINAIGLSDLEGRITYINSSFLKMWGYDNGQEGIVGRPAVDVWQDKEQFLVVKEEVIGRGSWVGEMVAMRKDGSTFHTHLSANIISDEDGSPISMMASFLDITDQKKIEEELRIRNFAIESSIDGIGIIDMEGKIAHANTSFLKMWGYNYEQEILGKPLKKFWQSEEVISEVLRILQDKGSWIGEPVAMRKDGSTFHTHLSANVISDEDGSPISMMASFLDITDRKKVEEELRESETKYRAVFEKSADGILMADYKTMKLKYTNPSICRMLGYEEDELKGMGVLDVHTKDTEQGIAAKFKSLIRGEKPEVSDAPLLKKNGEIMFADINASQIMIDGEAHNVAFFRDTTDRKKGEDENKRLEEQFQQAQRMEAIGTLAGGIAHDFNNLLMGIQGNVSLMLLDTEGRQTNFERLKNIEQHVESGAELTKQLLGFARRGKYEVKVINLNELVRKSSVMFGRTKKEIKIYRQEQKDIWSIEADRGQIEQVLLNIYVNAWQAMPDGGELHIVTENVNLDKGYVKPFSINPGRYVKISITDTGIGMSKRTQNRVFEPFFTSKRMGRGTGLGLAAAYGIIKNHGGVINVYSERGKGATFNIFLPVSRKRIAEEKDLNEEVSMGNETILLVDDEKAIVAVTKEVLEILGYEVLFANNGKSAVEIYEKNKEAVDLVILDMIMPDMSGGETYDKLKAFDPNVRVLLSSGYSLNGQASRILERGCDGFIQKPFNMKQLSQKIKKVFEKKE